MMMPHIARQPEPPGMHPAAAYHLTYHTVPASPISRQLQQPPTQRFPFQQDSVSARPLFRTHSSAHSPLIPIPTPAQRPSYQDNLLRRKTPSGTLPAAYDAAPIEWAATRPTKHILLPVQQAGSAQTVQRDAQGAMIGAGGGWERTGPNVSNINLQGVGNNAGTGSITPSLWSPQQSGPSLFDANLGPEARQILVQQNQLIPPAPDARFFNGQPYGFQPLYNPITAPTASCEDLNSYLQGVNYDNTPRNINWAGNYGGWDNTPTVPAQFPQLLMNNGYTPQQQSNAAIWPPLQYAGGDVRTTAPNQHAIPQLYNTPQPSLTQEQYSAPALDNFAGTFPTLTPQNRHSPHFRDSVLIWAHKAYMELQTSLQAQQREADSRSGNIHRKSSHSFRAGLFPRPPQPPFNAWQAGSYPTRAVPRQDHTPRSPFSNDGLNARKVLGEIAGQNTGCPDIGTSSSHSRTMLGGDFGFLNPGQVNAGVNGGIKANPPVDCYSLLQRIASGLSDEPSNHPVSTPVQNGIMPSAAGSMVMSQASVVEQAMAAHQLLESLCSDGTVPWTDGLLLGGCLAYALGNLDRAVDWYVRILKADENHVEALSNLGATFLSLNRQDEAAQYWRRAVKIRPSYFEAVEHLVSLLCGEHRGKEAVDVINFVERSLRIPDYASNRNHSMCSSSSSEESSLSTSSSPERMFDYELAGEPCGQRFEPPNNDLVHESSGYNIPSSDNGRMLALIHTKGNMLYTLGDNSGAAKAFESAVLVATGGAHRGGIRALINDILIVLSSAVQGIVPTGLSGPPPSTPVLLTPDMAVQTARLVFPPNGQLPGLRDIPRWAERATISTTSNSLLSLAKIFQDRMSSGAGATTGKSAAGVKEILALYYLSLSLHPSPSTANNVGILLASIPHASAYPSMAVSSSTVRNMNPNSGVGLALSYYYYGLSLDSRHAHLYTNLGSLLKDINHLPQAIKMYEHAVACDDNFDIALANLANAVKDQGRINDAIGYYIRAVKANPEFAEAVCGLANARNSVCDWKGRGGVVRDGGNRDRWHVDKNGELIDAKSVGLTSSGWMKRVVDIVEKQLRDGETWGRGVLVGDILEKFLTDIEMADGSGWSEERRRALRMVIQSWGSKPFEGSRIVRLVERASRRAVWRWYQDRYVRGYELPISNYARPAVPATLTTPSAPTVLPFHTFTCPLSAKQVRMISERNGLRISCSTLRAPWLPAQVYPPPAPPAPCLRVGYVSSDFNNHPLAHLMQSVFGLHDPSRVKAYCYATTAGDNSEHRKQIEREAPVFIDVHSWGPDRLVKQIIDDGIHILINLNGFTRGARNEIFAARPAPIQMSFMGFAGTLGAEWCDYLYADSTAVPQETLRPWRRNVDIEDELQEVSPESEEKWVYAENIIFARYTFFCCDHRQSAPDSKLPKLSWDEETKRRWEMRKSIFPDLKHDQIILGNFNQLYKIEPTTFRTWLRILTAVPKAILWLLRFPDIGENNLLGLAEKWAGSEVRSRIRFTDVAPKPQHISRAQVCDIFLDTPECNAHTTAADVLWSGTPLLTLPRHKYKMCSRIAASILRAAVPQTPEGKAMANSLIAANEDEYEKRAIELANGMVYENDEGKGVGELFNIRKVLFENRWTSELFDTKRWVRDLEDAYEEAWRRWVDGNTGGDIYLSKIEKSFGERSRSYGVLV